MTSLTNSVRATIWEPVERSSGWLVLGLFLRSLRLGMAFPSVLYLATLTIFLFRPPDLDLYHADRIAFGVLLFLVTLRMLALREKIPFVPGLSLPLLGLVGLAVYRALREPFDVQTWGLVANKFIVPFALLHVAILVFRSAAARRHFEIFVILALAYLAFTAVAFLVDARALIFPKFILDESLGIHFDRARGPFLQAVANGVSLNILGILAIVLARNHRKVVLLVWLALPLAILATMTRAVWIAFAFSVTAVGFRMGERRVRWACLGLVCIGLLLIAFHGASSDSLKNAVSDRTEDRASVDVRMAVYEAGWAMFKERPLAGWTAGGMYAELARRMEGYHLSAFYVHNTYLSLLIEFGIPGLVLYAILIFNLFRLSRAPTRDTGRPVSALRKAWPILLCVYLFNAFFVDMSYQFVIGLMFTVAGILCVSEEAAV
jgi:putative inorganic carbon (hco3(-)) transporter